MSRFLTNCLVTFAASLAVFVLFASMSIWGDARFNARYYNEDPATSTCIAKGKEYGNPNRKGCILWLQWCKDDPEAKRWGVVLASRYLTETFDDDIQRMIEELENDPDTAATVKYVKETQSKDWKTQ